MKVELLLSCSRIFLKCACLNEQRRKYGLMTLHSTEMSQEQKQMSWWRLLRQSIFQYQCFHTQSCHLFISTRSAFCLSPIRCDQRQGFGRLGNEMPLSFRVNQPFRGRSKSDTELMSQKRLSSSNSCLNLLRPPLYLFSINALPLQKPKI